MSTIEDLTVDVSETPIGVRYTFSSPVDCIKALLFRSGGERMILLDRSCALPLKEFLSVKYMTVKDHTNVKVTTNFGHTFEYENCTLETLIYIMKVLSDTISEEASEASSITISSSDDDDLSEISSSNGDSEHEDEP